MIMTNTTAKLCQKKAVLESVYVEKPTKKKVSSKNHHHHHYFVHHSIKLGDSTSAAGKGYNRRAQLLLYSQRLRESADHRSAQSSHSDTTPKPIFSNIMKPTQNVAAVQRKPKNDKTSSCPGNWKIVKFCRSLTDVQIKKDKKKKKHPVSTSNALKAVKRSLEVR